MTTLDDARRAKEQAVERYSSDANVVGVGIGREGRQFVVRINLKSSDRRSAVRIDGVPVRWRVTGRVKALGSAARPSP